MSEKDSIKIVETFPPNYKQICDRFPTVANTPDALFMYDIVLHNPHKIKLLDHVIIHETVHSYQQAGKPEEWYEKYFTDTQFRLSQEVEAYGMQFAYILDQGNHRDYNDGMLFQIAGKLKDPIYDFDLNYMQAELMIKRVAKEKIV
jgi:hypothetical protein